MGSKAVDGKKITLEYTGLLKDGKVFDTSEGRQPLTFTVGKGEVIKGFEEGVKGLSAESEKTIVIEPGQAYGEHNPALVMEVPKKAFSNLKEVQAGAQYTIQAPNGQIVQIKVVEVRDESLLVDLNHPLAGQELTFKVRVISVEP